MVKTRYLYWLLFICLATACAAGADTSVANDPAHIAVGARILGMGKAYAGVADDLLGIFINPAALGSVKRWQATTLASKFINEYNYYNFGAAMPVGPGSLGLGAVTSGISFLAGGVTTETQDGVRFIPATTEGSSYAYGSSLVSLAYGLQFNDAWSVGATYKLYFSSMAGPGITGGNAGGNELDLGASYVPNPVWRLGATIQNALPFTMGGKIKWESGAEEALPATVKSGLSVKLIGEDGWRQLGEQKLSYHADLDIFPGNSRLPSLWHHGVEWTPLQFIDFRAGIDQDYIGVEEGSGVSAVGNLTLGLGLFFNDYRFDYAFHQYQVSENNTHYFSLTYGIERGKPPYISPFAALQPADRTIVFTSEVKVRGEIVNRQIARVKVGELEPTLSGRTFEGTMALALGKNALAFQGLTKGGKLVESRKNRVLCLKAFHDVPRNYWAGLPISILAMESVISGYPGGLFKPDGRITRAEFTKLLMAVKGIGNFQPKGKPYKDVTARHWAARYIGFAAKNGLVKGYPGGNFLPNQGVSRAEGVSMIARFAALPEPRSLAQPFSDVPGRHWVTKELIRAKDAGILDFLGNKPFSPKKALTRAEVAEMLSKTPPLAERVKALLDWETGY